MQAGFRGERKRELTRLFPSVDLLQSRVFTLVRRTEADPSLPELAMLRLQLLTQNQANLATTILQCLILKSWATKWWSALHDASTINIDCRTFSDVGHMVITSQQLKSCKAVKKLNMSTVKKTKPFPKDFFFFDNSNFFLSKISS